MITHSTRFISRNFYFVIIDLIDSIDLELRSRKMFHSRFVRDSIERIALLAIGSIFFQHPFERLLTEILFNNTSVRYR